ncbi:EamA family transporter [Pseudoduganella sp. DS3]|uniref:EamA family transporter n=1 Tax=Pseudoduganella guangdongensis TaxID=2692179 RepID=A0A6N9HDA7_9BURK|nr:DMT family transporter [Pseudoduganella guangdongensis]MYN01132.1 EamA family transporter [Pseudoduganella guangdongensis]
MIYLKLIACTLIWGGTFIAGHIVSNALPPLTAAAIRFSIAGALLLVLAWQREGGLPRLSMQQLGATAALGLTGIFLYNFCFFSALGQMEASRSALFIAINPIVTALAAAAVLRERLTWRKWAGIGIAFVGAALLITRGEPLAAMHDISQSIGVGELMMLGAVTCWAAYTLVGRAALKGLTPIAATTYASLWGLGFLLLASARELPGVAWTSLGWQVWASVTYLGAFGTVVAFVWWYEGVKALGPARTAVFNNLVPVFGVSLAAVMLGEQVLASMVAGGLLVAAGVTITNR